MICNKCNCEFSDEYFDICPYCLEPIIDEKMVSNPVTTTSELINDSLDKEENELYQSKKFKNPPNKNTDDYELKVNYADLNDISDTGRNGKDKTSNQNCNNYIGKAIQIRNLNELSNRALNALNRQGVFTVAELHSFLAIRNIEDVRNIGVLTSKEIREFAERYKNIDDSIIKEYNLKNTEACNKVETNTSIDDIKELGTRSKNILKRLNIFTMGELLEFKKLKEIENIRGVGRLTTNEIHNVIRKYSKKAASSTDERYLNKTEDIGHYMFEEIDKSNEDLSIDSLVMVGVAPSAIVSIKSLDIKTFGDLKGYLRTDIISQVSQLNFSRIEDMEKLMKNSAKKVLKEILKRDMNGKEFKTYSQRADGCTLQEIADNPIDSDESVSRERIRQIEKRYYLKIYQIVKHITTIMMGTKKYLSTDDISEIYYENGFDRIFIHTCKRIEEFDYFDFADTFVLKDSAMTEENLVEIIEDYIKDGINLYEKIEDLEDVLLSNGYEFIDLGRIINLANKYNYTILGEFIFRRRPTYGLLCANIVKQAFPKGIKLNQNDESPEEDLLILRKIVQERYGDIGLPKSDRALSARISEYLVLSNRGMVIHPDHIHLDANLVNDIKRYIDTSDNTRLYYAEIFAEFEGILKLTSNIDNHNFLHGVLQYYYPHAYNYSRDFLIKIGAYIEEELSISDRINKFIMKMGRPVTKKELEKEFAGLSDTVLLMSILNDERLIQWKYNHYNSMDLIQYDDQDIEVLEELLIEVLAENNGYSSDTYYYERVKRKYNSFIEKNDIESEMNLFYIIDNMLNKDYDFRRPHIAVKGKYEILSTKEVVLDILKKPETISYDNFMELTSKLMWSTVTSSMVFKEIEQDYIRISLDKYLAIDKFTISQDNLDKINNIIKKRINYDILPIISIEDYSEFPEINYDWNEFLLGSIIGNLYQELILINPIIQDRRYQRGIITLANSGLNSYSEIIANIMMAHNIDSLTESKMLSFLIVNDLAKNTIPKELMNSEFVKFLDDKYVVMV